MKLIRQFSVMVVLMAMSYLAQAQAGFTVDEDIPYRADGGVARSMDVITPTENAKGIGLVYVVSRGWVSEKFPVASSIESSMESGGRLGSLVSNGYTLFFIRHRSAPEHTVVEAWEDIRRGVRFVIHHAEKFGVDPDRIGIFGNSAGGHLALMCGAAGDDGEPNGEDDVDKTPLRVAAVGTYYPPTDLRSVAGPNSDMAPLRIDASQAKSVSPIVFVDANDPPMLFIHGDRDKSVPLASSEAMVKALEDAGVDTKLVVIERAGHSFRGKNATQAADELTAWFDRYLAD